MLSLACCRSSRPPSDLTVLRKVIILSTLNTTPSSSAFIFLFPWYMLVRITQFRALIFIKSVGLFIVCLSFTSIIIIAVIVIAGTVIAVIVIAVIVIAIPVESMVCIFINAVVLFN